MKLASKDLIAEIPLFANLSEAESRIIRERSRILEYKKGEIIYQQGSPPSAFFCLLLGRAVVSIQDTYGNKRILEYLHRGKYFGIISLLTNELHSVTAQALNDSLLLVIKKSDFDFILKKIPRLAIDLSQTLSRRLKNKDIHEKTIFESTIIAVFSSCSQAGKTIYALNLALSLCRETRKSAVIIDIAPCDKIHSLPQRLGIKDYKALDLSSVPLNNPKLIKDFILKDRLGIDLVCLNYNPLSAVYVKSITEILGLLVNDYHYLILDLPSSMDRTVFNILNQADLVHILTSPALVDLKKTRNLTERLKAEFNFRDDKIKIIINEYRFSKLKPAEQIEVLKKDVFATLPKLDFGAADRIALDGLHCEYAKAIRRISREVSENLVGLVLGVGVAYGFCHIGVLKVIEEEKIPVDVIAGSSIGALIASLWATGRTSGEILEITKEFKGPKHIWGLVDLTMPFLGFIKGNKLYRFLKRYLGDKTFYDVRIPLKIIASDVKKKEPKVLEKGLLVDAVMASCAMPGVFIPFRLKEEMLFDGGVINPLPTEVLLKMGVKKIIAVNVTPSREDVARQYEKMKKEGFAGAKDIRERSWQENIARFFSLKVKRHLKSAFKTNILDIIFSSIEILQSEVAEKEAQLADIVLHPDTQGLYWLELHKSEEFARRGEAEARKNLDKVWQVIND